jgi:hypothetical protein
MERRYIMYSGTSIKMATPDWIAIILYMCTGKNPEIRPPSIMIKINVKAFDL